MTPLNITYDDKGLQSMKDFIVQHPERVEAALNRTAMKGKEWIVRDTPYGITGNAAKSWEIRQIDSFTFVIEATTMPGAAYVPYLEYGTGIYGPLNHMITPVNAEALKIPMGDGFIYRKSSHGMPGAHMVEENREPIEERLEIEMDKEYERVQ